MGSEIVQDHSGTPHNHSSTSIVAVDREHQHRGEQQPSLYDDTDSIDTNLHNPKQRRRLLVRDLNECLTCSLCEGYLIDATVITICLHTFCRSCIVRYLESSRYCPTCEIQVHKSKPLSALRTDKSLQLLIYKLIPSVYQNEVKRRSEFYLQARASSSCSEDSILTDSEQHEQSVLSHINENDDVEFFSPDDSISLSLEYYQDNDILNKDDNNKRRESDIGDAALLDIPTSTDDNNITTHNDDNNITPSSTNIVDTSSSDLNNSSSSSSSDTLNPSNNNNNNNNNHTSDIKPISSDTSSIESQTENASVTHKRYLQCPAGVNVKHLTKFIRMKYGLSYQHRVDIIYEDEILPKHFTLMDVAYTFKWKRTSPMRFMYRIFESTKSPIFRSVYRQQDVKVSSVPSSIQSSLPSLTLNMTEESQTSVQETHNNTTNISTEKTDQSVKKNSSFAESILRKELTKPLRRDSDEKRPEKSEGKSKKHKRETQPVIKDDPVIDEPKNESSDSQTTAVVTHVDEREDEKNVDKEEDEEDMSEKEREILEFAKKRDLEWANLIQQSQEEIEEEEETEVQQQEVREEEEEEDVDDIKLEKRLENAKLKLKESKESSQERHKKKQKFDDKIVPPVIRDIRVSLENKDYYDRSIPKKRKKSKHSKHFANYSKRRKIHAEIQNQSNSNDKDDILKLKVKLTPTIHKVHKHKHSSSNNHDYANESKTTVSEKTSRNHNVHAQFQVDDKETKNHKHEKLSSSTNTYNNFTIETNTTTTSIKTNTSSSITATNNNNNNTNNISTTIGGTNDMSAKERLLQMRQVRHKHVQQEKLKTQPETTSSTTSISNSTSSTPITNNSHLPPPQKKVRFNDEPILTSPTQSPTVTITSTLTTTSNNQITVPAIKSPTNITSSTTTSSQVKSNSSHDTDTRKINKCVPNLVAPKSFTVSKIDMNTLQEKRKDPEDEIDPKVPSLEIMLINPSKSQTKSNDNNRTNNTTITTTASANTTKANNYQNTKQGGMQIKPLNNNHAHNNKFAKLSLMQSKVLMMKNLNLTQINNKNNLNMNNKTPIVAKSSSGMEVTKTIPTSPSVRSSPGVSNNNNQSINSTPTATSLASKVMANSTKITQQQRPTPVTIPLSRIKKISQNNYPINTTTTSGTPPPPNGKIPQKVDNFGALDLSSKSPDNRLQAETKQKMTEDSTNPSENKANVKIEVQKIVQNNHNLSNLHILSESAVHIRDLMVSAQNKNMTSTASQTMIRQKLKDATQKLINQTTNNNTSTSNKSPIILPQSKQTALVNKLLNSNSKNTLESPSTIKIPPTTTTTNSTTNNVRVANKLPLQPITAVDDIQRKLTLNNINENKTTKNSAQDSKTSTESNNIGKTPSGTAAATSSATALEILSSTSTNSTPTTTYPMLQQTLRIPVLQNSKSLQQQMRNLQKMPKPETKLNHQFSTQQVRAIPNQTVRNIPNPSALMARHAQAAAVAQSHQATTPSPLSSSTSTSSSSVSLSATTQAKTSSITLNSSTTSTTATAINNITTSSSQSMTTESSSSKSSSSTSSSSSSLTTLTSTTTSSTSSSVVSADSNVNSTSTSALNQINGDNTTGKPVLDNHNKSTTCSPSSNDK